jgi:dextranase
MIKSCFFFGALLGLAVTAAAEPGVLSGLHTDQARYAPDAVVGFGIDVAADAGVEALRVRVRQGNDTVHQQTLSVSSAQPRWDWRPPTRDYRGYLVEVEALRGGSVIDQDTIGVDVSSDWTRFPRYGFLSDFGFKTDAQMDQVIAKLNRYHINGVQFYDWAHQHHDPLKGTAGDADGTWPNVANQTNYMGTVRGYIDRAHHHNMQAMSYNLANAAFEDAADDGVSDDWYLYTDPQATTIDRHDLPDDWQSDLLLVDPANPGWQDYLGRHTADAYREFAFDGSHIDTLGDRGRVYAKPGYAVDLAWSYGQFVDSIARNVGGDVVVNAVNQFGQAEFAQRDVAFLYTEVWDPNDSYQDLADILRDNRALSGGRLNTVLAAYVNYERNKASGEFNPASVLLTNAVIFAHGGAHLEVGEHLLANEYFPYSNLDTSPALDDRLTDYYDFMVGYQNLLRDGGAFGDKALAADDGSVVMGMDQRGKVAGLHQRVGRDDVFHLINFTDAPHLRWRDTDGTQPTPTRIDGLDLSFFSYLPVGEIWAASPDTDGGAPVSLDFVRGRDGSMRVTLPSLEYWSMVVAEEARFTGADRSSDAAYAEGWQDGADGGTGFGAWRLTSSTSPDGFAGFWTSSGEAIDNAGAIDRGADPAWASFANSGDGVERASAFRSFDHALAGEGDRFGLTMEHGLIDGRVGVSLRHGNAADDPEDYDRGSRLQFYFEGGDANYTLLDGDGESDTGIAWTDFGLKLEISLIDADRYDLLVWRFDEENDRTPEVFTFEDRRFLGDGPIESFALFQSDGPGDGLQDDVYFNHLYYHAVEVPEPGTLAVLTLGLLATGRRRRTSASSRPR